MEYSAKQAVHTLPTWLFDRKNTSLLRDLVVLDHCIHLRKAGKQLLCVDQLVFLKLFSKMLGSTIFGCPGQPLDHWVVAAVHKMEYN